MADQAETTTTAAPAANAAAPAADAKTTSAAAPAPADSKTVAPTAEAPKTAEPAKPAAGETLLGGEGDVARPGSEAAKPVPVAIKVPEGFDTAAPIVAKWGELAAADGLKPEIAQKYFDLFAAEAKPLLEAQKALAQAQTEADTTQKQWVDAIRRDPELGGAKLEANVALARKAVATYGGEELRTFLDSNGLGNNPLLFKHFVAIGRALGEPTTKATESRAPASSGLARMYPSMFTESKH